MSATNPQEILLDQEMTRQDREAAEAFLKAYRRSTRLVDWTATSMAFLMMGFIYFVEPPLVVTAIFGTFLLGILMLIGYIFRKALRDLRTDIDKGRKNVLSGYIMEKRKYNKSDDDADNDLDFKKLGVLRRTGDGVWNLSGQFCHVSYELWNQAEVGDRVVLHVLPGTRIPFKVEKGVHAFTGEHPSISTQSGSAASDN